MLSELFFTFFATFACIVLFSLIIVVFFGAQPKNASTVQ
jgi:hypothetical protein